MIKDAPPAAFAVQFSSEEITRLAAVIEEKVIQNMNDNPEKFFKQKPFSLTLYSTADVSRILKISEATVRNRCKDGSMSYMRPDGRNIMVSQEQLEQYIESVKVACNE